LFVTNLKYNHIYFANVYFTNLTNHKGALNEV